MSNTSTFNVLCGCFGFLFDSLLRETVLVPVVPIVSRPITNESLVGSPPALSPQDPPAEVQPPLLFPQACTATQALFWHSKYGLISDPVHALSPSCTTVYFKAIESLRLLFAPF